MDSIICQRLMAFQCRRQWVLCKCYAIETEFHNHKNEDVVQNIRTLSDIILGGELPSGNI